MFIDISKKYVKYYNLAFDFSQELKEFRSGSTVYISIVSYDNVVLAEKKAPSGGKITLTTEELKRLNLGVTYQVAYFDSPAAAFPIGQSTFKYTAKPSLNIKVNKNSLSFEGTCTTTDFTEKVIQYAFELYDQDKLILSSGWKNHFNQYDIQGVSFDDIQFFLSTEKSMNLTAFYKIKTSSGLNETSAGFPFLFNPILVPFDIQALLDNNKYCVSFYTKTMPKVSHFALLKRLNEEGSTWERIWDSKESNLQLNEKIPFFSDYFLDNNIEYIYGVQGYQSSDQIDAPEILTKLIRFDSVYKVTFEDILLEEDGKQIAVKFNPRISSVKDVHLEEKVDTFGNRYPYFFRNPIVSYREFSLSGLISCLMESDQEIKTNLTLENIFTEKNYRESIYAWLTNGSPKLFRSPTEKMCYVQLININLTPEDVLGRMLYSFSAQAFETAPPKIKKKELAIEVSPFATFNLNIQELQENFGLQSNIVITNDKGQIIAPKKNHNYVLSYNTQYLITYDGADFEKAYFPIGCMLEFTKGLDENIALTQISNYEFSEATANVNTTVLPREVELIFKAPKKKIYFRKAVLNKEKPYNYGYFENLANEPYGPKESFITIDNDLSHYECGSEGRFLVRNLTYGYHIFKQDFVSCPKDYIPVEETIFINGPSEEILVLTSKRKKQNILFNLVDSEGAPISGKAKILYNNHQCCPDLVFEQGISLHQKLSYGFHSIEVPDAEIVQSITVDESTTQYKIIKPLPKNVFSLTIKGFDPKVIDNVNNFKIDGRTKHKVPGTTNEYSYGVLLPGEHTISIPSNNYTDLIELKIQGGQSYQGAGSTIKFLIKNSTPTGSLTGLKRTLTRLREYNSEVYIEPLFYPFNLFVFIAKKGLFYVPYEPIPEKFTITSKVLYDNKWRACDISSSFSLTKNSYLGSITFIAEDLAKVTVQGFGFPASATIQFQYKNTSLIKASPFNQQLAMNGIFILAGSTNISVPSGSEILLDGKKIQSPYVFEKKHFYSLEIRNSSQMKTMTLKLNDPSYKGLIQRRSIELCYGNEQGLFAFNPDFFPVQPINVTILDTHKLYYSLTTKKYYLKNNNNLIEVASPTFSTIATYRSGESEILHLKEGEAAYREMILSLTDDSGIFCNPME